MNAKFKLALAALPMVFLCHSAMAQESSGTANAQQQKVARHVKNASWTGDGKTGQHQQPAVKQPVDNDHDPRFQKLKIHDPNYTAAMSFE